MGQGVEQDEQQQQQQQQLLLLLQQVALVPFTVRAVCYRDQHKPPSWRLSCVAALLKALGATHGDRVLLNRLPGGRVTIRLLAGAEREADAAAAPQVAQLERAQPCSQARAQPSAEGSQRATKRPGPAQEHGAVAWQQHDEHQLRPQQEPSPPPPQQQQQQQQQQQHYRHHQPQQQCPQPLQQQRPGLVGPRREGTRVRPPDAAVPSPAPPPRAAPPPPGSMLVGFAESTTAQLRQAAVAAFFPVATSLAHGQTVHVMVYGPGPGAAGGLEREGQQQQQQQQQVLLPYCLRLSFCQGRCSRYWRLSCCGPLFRALGARKGDAVHMWRSAVDGRLCAGLQPGDTARAQRWKRKAGGQGVGRQAYGEDKVHEATKEGELDEGDGGAVRVGPSGEGGRWPAGEGPLGGVQGQPGQLGRRSSRSDGEQWELSETSEEEEDVQLDEGDSGEEEGHGGAEGQGWDREEGEEDVGQGVGGVTGESGSGWLGQAGAWVQCAAAAVGGVGTRR